jgi:hypothetical protein
MQEIKTRILPYHSLSDRDTPLQDIKKISTVDLYTDIRAYNSTEAAAGTFVLVFENAVVVPGRVEVIGHDKD